MVSPKDPIDKKLQQDEQDIDLLQKDLVEYISALLSHNLSAEDRIALQKQIRLADEYESISDHVVIIVKLRNKIVKAGLKMTDQDKANLLDLHAFIMSYVANINELVKSGDRQIFKRQIRWQVVQSETAEVSQNPSGPSGGKYGSPGLSLFYVDILSSFAELRERALNVAEIIAIER
jgi:phosphate:Na+ symporter